MLSSASDPNEATKQLRDNLANDLLKSQADATDDPPGKVRLPIHTLTNMGSAPSSGAGSPATVAPEPPTSSVLSVKPDKDVGSATPTPQQSPPPKDTDLSSNSRTNLESLGIPEPFVSVKSKRRSRRPFTTPEDEALLKGYAVHGFQWTLIQQDKRLNLSHRRATDLRDRFRTKFPHAYRDGGSVNGNAMNKPKLESSNSDPGPVPRDRPASTESTPTKAPPIVHRRSDPHIHSRQTSSVSHANTGTGPFDPSFLPPPQGFLETSGNALSFSLEENPAGPSSPWEDNTLAPMIWDDLG